MVEGLQLTVCNKLLSQSVCSVVEIAFVKVPTNQP